MDSQVRQLERRLACGDESARKALKVMQCRTSGHPGVWRHVDPDSPVDNPRSLGFGYSWGYHLAEARREAALTRKPVTVCLQCFICDGRETATAYPELWATGTSGVITFNYAAAETNLLVTDPPYSFSDAYGSYGCPICEFEHKQHEECAKSNQRRNWHPTKPRPWKAKNRKTKRKAVRLARRKARK